MRSYTWKNQSLVGVSNRLLRHVDADAASAPHQPIYVNLANLKFAVVNAIVVGIALALLGLGLFFPRGTQLYGNTFFATLLLFVGLSIELLRCKKRSEQMQPAAS